MWGWSYGLIVSIVAVTPNSSATKFDAQADRVERLIVQLGHPEPVMRELAEAELRLLGDVTFDALNEAQAHTDIEIATRSHYLLRNIHIDWTREDDPPEVRTLLERYSKSNPVSRRSLVRQLVGLQDGQGVEPACRVIRFDPWEHVSRETAIELLYLPPPFEWQNFTQRDAILATLSPSRRPAARWITTHLKSLADPRSTLDDWQRITEEEAARRKEAPEDASSQILAMLTYHYAAICGTAGENERAEKIASRALDLTGDNAFLHYSIADSLKKNGLIAWAAEEYQRAIDAGPPSDPIRIFCQYFLSEMHHDQGQELEAAQVLEVLVDSLEDKSVQRVLQTRSFTSPASLRARLHYFQAMHYAQQNNARKVLAELDEAARDDPADADVLIALYQLSSEESARRRRVSSLIKSAASVFSQQIVENPESPTPYNQYAWLVGNSEGDYDQAIEYSHRSLELRPDAAGYLDTLAHCYFAKGDVASAVKYQEKAVRLEPYSGQIRRKLTLFQETLKASSSENFESGPAPAVPNLKAIQEALP